MTVLAGGGAVLAGGGAVLAGGGAVLAGGGAGVDFGGGFGAGFLAITLPPQLFLYSWTAHWMLLREI